MCQGLKQFDMENGLIIYNLYKKERKIEPVDGFVFLNGMFTKDEKMYGEMVRNANILGKVLLRLLVVTSNEYP